MKLTGAAILVSRGMKVLQAYSTAYTYRSARENQSMGFRRSDDEGPTGSRWRLAHRALLGECGIPAEVADSDCRWIYVLLHGDDYPGTGWDVSWLSPSQAAKLLAVLECELESWIGYDLFRLLRQRAQA